MNSNSDLANDIETLPQTLDFEIFKCHQRMEVYESRILAGVESKYKHPAEVIEMDKELLYTVYTKDECERADRFLTIPENKIIPNFWPSRNWDSAENILDETKTEDLSKRIREVTPNISRFWVLGLNGKGNVNKVKHSNSSSGFDKKRKCDNHRTIIKLNTIKCMTDDSDDFTEIEDL